jgi:hypothetical protein
VKCLETYLGLKRCEENRASAGVPSDEVRLRLRRDVEREFRPRGARPEGRGVRAALTRPIPLYQGLVVAAVAVIVAAAVPAFTHRAAPAREGARVDTSRPSAESLTIY